MNNKSGLSKSLIVVGAIFIVLILISAVYFAYFADNVPTQQLPPETGAVAEEIEDLHQGGGLNLTVEEVNEVVQKELDLCVEGKVDNKCLSIVNQDISICGENEECKEEYNFILALKGANSCDAIVNVDNKAHCFAVTTKNSETCNSLPSGMKEGCLSFLQDDVSVCDSLSGELLQSCNWDYHFGKAIVDGQVEFCDNLPVFDAEDHPFNPVQFCKAISSSDVSKCGPEISEYCKENMLFENLNLRDCLLISDEALREPCTLIKSN